MSDFISGQDIILQKGIKDFELIPLAAGRNAFDSLGKPIENPIRELISSSILYHEGEIAGNEVRKRKANEEIQNRWLEIDLLKKGTSTQLKDFINHRSGTSPISKTEWKKRQIANHERVIQETVRYLESNPDDAHIEAIKGLRHIEEFLASGLSPIAWDDFWPLFKGYELTPLIEKLKVCLFKSDNIKHNAGGDQSPIVIKQFKILKGRQEIMDALHEMVPSISDNKWESTRSFFRRKGYKLGSGPTGKPEISEQKLKELVSHPNKP